MSDKIKHKGIIESTDGGVVRVRIVQSAACASCRAARHCSASESKEKLVEVFRSPGTHQKGDEVVLVASNAVGARAVMYGFGLPFVIMVSAVWLISRFTSSEPLAALGGIACLVPYYAALYLCRDKLRQKLSFSIEE